MVKKRIKPVKKGILDLVFSRVFVLAVLVIIQLVVFGATVTFLQEYAKSKNIEAALKKGTWAAARNAEKECPGTVL